jgi:RecA-family ATPase
MGCDIPARCVVSHDDDDWRNVADPGELEEARHKAARRGENGKTSPSQFTLVRFCDIQLGKEPPYLVRNLIPREGLAVVWGPPKCGKTFWAFDVMMHVALGWEYRNCRVEQGTVVYIACEGERGLAARKEAFRQTHLTENDDPPFYLLTTRLDLAAQIDALIFEITAQLPDGRCSAIVLDTLNRSIGGSESDDADMGAYVKAADKLREKFGCAVVIIHHCGINDKRPRGHTSLTGAADAQISVTREARDRSSPKSSS